MKKKHNATLGRPQRRMWVAVVLTLSMSLSAFAQTGFLDVEEAYWGAPYILTAAEAGIINGYPTQEDGVFRFDPENPVSKQESLAMIYRTLQSAGLLQEETDLAGSFAQQLNAAGVAEWARLYAAYGFRYEYVTAGDFLNAGAATLAPRQLIATWAAKAMNYETASVAALPYADGAKISDEAFVYTDALYRNQIMTGDNKGNLNPLDGIRRVEFAAVCTRLLEDAERMAQTPQAARKLQDSLILHSGTVKSVQASSRRLQLQTADGSIQSVRLSPDATVLMDGREVSASDLAALENKFVSISCLMGAGRQVLIDTGVRVQKGWIESLSSEDDYGVLTLSTEDGMLIRYCYDDETLADVTIRRGIDVSLIADGAYVLEIK
ncbi:MAG: S-layer homology domain-containing protein [Eubacteriales bacterium]|nr:S-layer homology domain-containing protein [Eubacteriales bacterium]MDD4445006.1 S-layer homology domain-containing protein [Eubacteriales bacterium]